MRFRLPGKHWSPKNGLLTIILLFLKSFIMVWHSKIRWWLLLSWYLLCWRFRHWVDLFLHFLISRERMCCSLCVWSLLWFLQMRLRYRCMTLSLIWVWSIHTGEWSFRVRQAGWQCFCSRSSLKRSRRACWRRPATGTRKPWKPWPLRILTFTPRSPAGSCGRTFTPLWTPASCPAALSATSIRSSVRSFM